MGSRRAHPGGVAQRDPKQSIEPSMNRKSRRKRPKNDAFEQFCDGYLKHRSIPYVDRKGTTGGFVQLAVLRKRLDLPVRASPDGWERAVANYFATPQGSYTLADLCARYDVFLKSALDRFNKPTEGGNGTKTESRFERNMRQAGLAD